MVPRLKGMCISFHQKECVQCKENTQEHELAYFASATMLWEKFNTNDFKYLYGQPMKNLRNYILYNGGNLDDINDIFQDSIVALLTKNRQNNFQNFQQLENFLFVVGRNLWINKVKRDKRSVSLEVTTTLHQTKLHDTRNQLADIISTERLLSVQKLVHRLDGNCRQILDDTINRGMSMKEISEKRGYKNHNVVKSLHYRCKKNLLHLIEEDPEVYQLLRFK